MVFNVEDFKLCSIGESGSKNRKRVKLIRCRSSKIHHSKTSVIYYRFYWILRYFYLLLHLLCYGHFDFNVVNNDYGIIGELALWTQSKFYDIFEYAHKSVRYLFKHTVSIYNYINAAFSFTSFGCNEIRFNDGAPGSLKVHGQIYHGIGKYFGPKNDSSGNYKPQFASIYFFDTASEFENRMDFSYFPSTKIGKKVQENVEKIMHEFSPFVEQFKSAIERSLNENIPDLQIVLRADLKPADAHKGRYNAPTVSQIAAVMPSTDYDDSDPRYERSIILYCQDNDNVEYDPQNPNDLTFINELHPQYDPLQYPMMFPEGAFGWCPDKYPLNNNPIVSNTNNNISPESDIESDSSESNTSEIDISEYDTDSDIDSDDSDIHVDYENNFENMSELIDLHYSSDIELDSKYEPQQKPKRGSNGKFLTARQFYRFRTMFRDPIIHFNRLQRYGKLWQQYLVDMFLKIETNELNYLRFQKQTELCRVYYDGLTHRFFPTF
eukprot:166185_1